ncbi:LacI family DNA-binding transcriptional regulator [Streptosporangium fragile]|uniref:LacI family DNA-binding transcriptional regulator n=2 Tax=Streptosporangium fragile TaxID=46186 RepID=A0ABN3VQ20_9ACTN
MATAARALGGYGYVSPATREQVLAAAVRLGYQPNDVARSMRAKTTRTIGFVGADIVNPFFANAMRGVSDVARQHGFDVFLTNSDERLDLEQQAVRALLVKQVDGIILAPTGVGDAPHLRSVVESGTPLVFIDRALADVPADSICIDNVAAAETAVGHLLALGHRRIALVAESPVTGDDARCPVTDDDEWAARSVPDGVSERPDDRVIVPSAARAHGYLRAHRAAGVPVDSRLARRVPRYSQEAARDEVRRMLALPDPPTALFASDNIMGLGTVVALREAGLTMPDDISLVTFDDLDWTAITTPPITVIRQPVYDMGAEAARRLLARVNGDTSPPARVELPVRLLVRGSTARPGPRSS